VRLPRGSFVSGFWCSPEGLLLEEIAPGLTVDDVQRATEAKLRVSAELKTM
jgi:acyl CoA:acetate/3-ketoacid CoA transferase beta subunit